jgi:superfamily I DNA and RNA helicase
MGAFPEVTEVQRVHLEPGDIIVLHLDRRTTQERADDIKVQAEAIFAPHKVMLVTGIEITTVAQHPVTD